MRLFDLEELLHGPLDGLGDGADRDLDRVAHVAARDLLDVRRHRGREHHRLPVRGQGGEDLADLRHEAHVVHAVGLVHDEHARLRQRHRRRSMWSMRRPGVATMTFGRDRRARCRAKS